MGWELGFGAVIGHLSRLTIERRIRTDVVSSRSSRGLALMIVTPLQMRRDPAFKLDMNTSISWVSTSPVSAPHELHLHPTNSTRFTWHRSGCWTNGGCGSESVSFSSWFGISSQLSRWGEIAKLKTDKVKLVSPGVASDVQWLWVSNGSSHYGRVVLCW